MPHEPAPATLLPLTTALHEAVRHAGQPVLEVLLQHAPVLSGAALLTLTAQNDLIQERQAGAVPAGDSIALPAILAAGEVEVSPDGARCVVPLGANRALVAYAAPGGIDPALAATLRIAGQMIDLGLARAEAEIPADHEAAARDLRLRQLSLAVEQSPSIVIITDMQGKIEYVNSRFTSSSGYSAEEALGQDVGFLRYTHDRPETELWEGLAAGREWRGEFRNRKKSGEEFWVSASITAIRDDSGQIIQYLAVQQDITEQKRTAEALRQQQEFLSRLIEYNPSPLLVKDWDGRFILANRAFAEIYGTTPDEIVGKTDFDFNPDREQVEQFLADDREVMRSGQAKFIPEEELNDAVTGEPRWMQSIKAPLPAPDGSNYVLAVATDITERKHLELRIQESLIQRGQQVATVTQIAQEIAASANLDTLFERVVTLIKERFGFYHTQIFRYDPANQVMRLQVGYGEAGRLMLEAKHSLPLGRGVVGMATSTGHSVLATDTAADPDWVPNPFLPQTRGELAVPIKLRGELLGILDVQSDTPGRLTAEDQFLLEGLCGQIAIVIESTRLLEEANIFRQLILASGQGIGMATLDGRVHFANSRLLEMAQEPDLAAMQRHDFHDYYPLHLHDRLDNEILPALRAGGEWTGEMGLLARDGTITPTLENFFTVKDEAGQPQYIASLMTDIGNIKAAEAAISAERTLLRTLIDNLPDFIYVKDTEARFLITNQALAEYMGAASPEETIGKTDRDFYPAEAAAKFRADDLAVIRSGEPFVAEESVLNEAGQRVWTLTTKLPMRDAQGNVIGLVGVGRDITESKLFEERLAAERNLLRTLIDNIPDSVFVKDRQSRNLLNNIVHYRDILGVTSQEEALGKTDFDFFPKEMAQDFYENEQALMASGEALIDHEHRVLKPDGSTIYHLNTKVPLRDPAGTVIGLVGIARDITDRREAEAERDRLLALEREQRQYSEVLAELSLSLTSKTNLDDMLASVLDYAVELAPVAETATLLLIRGGQACVMGWVDQINIIDRPEYARQTLPLAAVPGLAPLLADRKPMIIGDALTHPDWTIVLRNVPWQRSLLIVPLVQRGQVLGFLWLTNRAKDRFTQAVADRLMPLANAAAIALDNNRLLQEAQQHAEREERLNQIGVRIQQHTEMADLLTVTLQELGQTLGAKVGRIRLAVSEGQPRPDGGENGHTSDATKGGRA